MSGVIRKILKNKTGSNLNMLSVDVQNDGSFEVSPNMYLKLADTSCNLHDLILSGGVVINNGSRDLAPIEGLIFAKKLSILDANEIIYRQVFTIHKWKSGNNRMSSNNWFDSFPSSNSSGSYSGFNSSAMPYLVSSDSYIKEAQIIFRRARYNDLNSSGNIFLELGFYTLDYNSSSDHCILGVELEGDFSGDDTNYGDFRFTISNFTELVGSNYFSKGDLVGVQLRNDIGGDGKVLSLYDPYIQLTFEEIKND